MGSQGAELVATMGGVDHHQFIVPGDDRWTNFLDRTPHDFYHTPGYLELSARYEGGTACAYWAKHGSNEILVPLLIRELPQGFGQSDVGKDATSPYGYPGPLVAPESSPDVVDAMLQMFIDDGREMGLVCCFIRCNPLSDSVSCYPVMQRFGELYRHGETVVIDLDQDEEVLFAGLRKSHRYEIRKLARDGFSVVFDDYLFLDAFIQLYYLSMDRLAASSFYYFDKEYFTALQQSLGSNLHLCCSLAPSGEVASAALFVKSGKFLQYHLSATAEKYRKLAPGKMIIDYMMRWGARNECSVFHLGGGAGGESDPLFRFKAGFSDKRGEFYSWRPIFNPPEYDRLVELGKHIDPETEVPQSFFPRYRGYKIGKG